MFRLLSIVALAGTIGIVALRMASARKQAQAGAACAPSPRWWERAVFALLWLGFAMMALTGFAAVIGAGSGSIGGWLLLFHFAAAPMFIFGLLFVVFVWGQRNLFNQPVEAAAPSVASRVFFWLVAVSGFITIATVLASMAPVLPSESQHALFRVHRYGALTLAVSMLGHLSTTCCAGRRAAGKKEAEQTAETASV